MQQLSNPIFKGHIHINVACPALCDLLVTGHTPQVGFFNIASSTCLRAQTAMPNTQKKTSKTSMPSTTRCGTKQTVARQEPSRQGAPSDQVTSAEKSAAAPHSAKNAQVVTPKPTKKNTEMVSVHDAPGNARKDPAVARPEAPMPSTDIEQDQKKKKKKKKVSQEGEDAPQLGRPNLALSPEQLKMMKAMHLVEWLAEVRKYDPTGTRDFKKDPCPDLMDWHDDRVKKILHDPVFLESIPKEAGTKREEATQSYEDVSPFECFKLTGSMCSITPRKSSTGCGTNAAASKPRAPTPGLMLTNASPLSFMQPRSLHDWAALPRQERSFSGKNNPRPYQHWPVRNTPLPPTSTKPLRNCGMLFRPSRRRITTLGRVMRRSILNGMWI